jgi:hypothetical protein
MMYMTRSSWSSSGRLPFFGLFFLRGWGLRMLIVDDYEEREIVLRT